MKQIFPLLAGGVLVAGFMLGRPGHAALIPEHYIQSLLGGNLLWDNLIASVAGALMYFATLTEVPILQGLIGAGMGKGPALSLLLAGPALSLPNIFGQFILGLVIGFGLLGLGFIFTHSTLLIRATEFAMKARGAAMFLVAFCFMGGGGVGTAIGGKIAMVYGLSTLIGVYGLALVVTLILSFI